MLDERPDWGPYFALGEDVIFVVDGRAYEITAGDFASPDVPDAPDPGPDPDVPDAPDPGPDPDVPDAPDTGPDPDVPDAPDTGPDSQVPSAGRVNGDGDSGWQTWAIVVGVVAAVAVALIGLVLRSRRPPAKDAS